MPKQCPLCGFEVVKPEGEVMHRCPNRACPSRGLETLINWVEGRGDIEGVGEQTVRRLWELGLVRSLPDLYRLTKEQLLELDGYAEISATNAIESIQASKQVPFSRVLLGLNIPEVGWVLAQNLARHFGDVDRLMAATQEEVEEVDGFGPDRAELVVEWFADEQNRALVQELRDARPAVRDRRGGPAGRGAADRLDLRHHGHARALHARRGEGGARGAGREGHRLGLEEDDRPRRRRGARRVEARRRRRRRRADPDRAGLRRAARRVGGRRARPGVRASATGGDLRRARRRPERPGRIPGDRRRPRCRSGAGRRLRNGHVCSPPRRSWQGGDRGRPGRGLTGRGTREAGSRARSLDRGRRHGAAAAGGRPRDDDGERRAGDRGSVRVGANASGRPCARSGPAATSCSRHAIQRTGPGSGGTGRRAIASCTSAATSSRPGTR